MFPDGVRSCSDPAVLVGEIPRIDEPVQFRDRVDFNDRDKMVAAKPADVTLDSAFLVRTLDAGLAVERVDA